MRWSIILLCLYFVVGCSVNPVTGKSQLNIVSEEQELAMGEKHYQPMQQSEGGVYKVDPKLTPYVNSVGQALAKVSDRPLDYEFVVLNNDVPNAWALPGGKIAINRGMLVLLQDEAQLAAILGHEIVHAAARHGATQQSKSQLTGIGLALASLHSEVNEYSPLLYLGANAVLSSYSRDQELESDAYGTRYIAKVGYDPQAAVELTEILLNLSKGQRRNQFAALFATHPPSQIRVDANRELVKTLGASGKRNKARFLNATAQLRKDQPAYDLHASALQAAGKNQWGKALSLTQKAIKKQPKESLFWVTKGRIQTKVGTRSQSLASFNRAIALNASHYAPYLYRGLTHMVLKQYKAAKKDFIQSNRYLDTTPANYYLGKISLTQGSKREATRWFQKASQGQGRLAESARAQLIQLR